MGRLSFGFGAVISIAFFGCSRTEHAPAPAVDRSELGGETIHPQSSPAADERATRARALFTVDGRSFLRNADVDTFRAFGDAIEVTPSAYKNAAQAIRARYPHVANGALTVSSGAMRVDAQPKGFGPASVEWSERTAVYRGAAANLDLYRVANQDGVEDFYQIDAPRDLSFTYDVKLTNVAGLRLVADTLELLDAAGTPQLRMSTPILADSKGRTRAGKISVSGCAYDTTPTGPWGRAVTAPGATSCAVTVTFANEGLAFPVLVDPAWQATANTMKQSHAYHKLLLLPAGADKDKVLAVGGTGSLPLKTDLFDPATQTWAASTDLPTIPTGGFGIGTNAVAFSTGRVLIAGGFGITTSTDKAQGTTAVRDPATAVWSTGDAMDARAWHTMSVTTIASREVAVVVGGQQSTFLSLASPALKSTQIYDPALGWASGGNLNTGRDKHRAVVLTDGRVLAAGGEAYTTFTQSTNTSEVFNLATKTWSSAGTMTTARTQPELVAIGNKAVIAGGSTSYSSASGAVNTLEVWDGTSTWKILTATMSQTRWQFASAKLDDGKILFLGGQTYEAFSTTQSATSDLFNPGSDPATGTTVGGGAMIKERTFHAAVNVPSLGVLVAGGLSGATETTASEVFNTKVGAACGTGCAAGTTCRDGVCCLTATCGTGESCANPGREGVCTKANGATCGGNNECASGYCIGSFCCESACTGTCSTCDAAGKCIKTPAGKLCQGQGECGRTCDAIGTCTFTYIPVSTKCGTAATDAGTGSFCSTESCSGSGSCNKTTNNCGLTCSTSVTCNEATKTCMATAVGIKAGYCVIDGKCLAYGDINPTDSCQVCDPPTSKTAWSTAVSCMDGSVDTGSVDTGAVEDTGSDDTGSTGDDTGSTGDDTGTTGDDTGTDDASADAAIGADLPEASACGCSTPGQDHSNTAGVTLAALGIAIAVASRRRRA